MIRDASTVLKLEVETDPVGMPNLIQNPNGANPDGYGGAWGWITPLSGTAMTGDGTSLAFFGNGSISTAAYWQSDYLPLTAAQYVGARFDTVSLGGFESGHSVKCRFQFFDSDKNVISQSAQSSAFASASVGTHYVSAVVAPAGTAYVKLRFDFYKGAGDPDAGAFYSFNNAMVTFDSSTFANSYSFSEPVTYGLDILGPTTSITISRKPLDPGTIGVTVIDASLDPADADSLRTGRRFRIRALNDDTATWDTLAGGFTILDAEVKYDLTKPPDRQAQIQLTVIDVLQVLSNTIRPKSVGTIDELTYVLETVGVPWRINGMGDQNSSPPDITVTQDQATALDQVVLARDSELGYAWIDRFGIVVASSDIGIDFYSDTSVMDEDVYTSIDVAFDTSKMINEVLVVLVHESGGEPVETVYGPFRDAASVGRWKVVRQATFRVTGLTAGEVTTLAANVLAANSEPTRRVQAVSVAINTPADITPLKALIDHYAYVQVINAGKSIDVTHRVTSITHSIYASVERGLNWIMTLGFGNDGAVSTPAPTGAGGSSLGAAGAPGPPGLPGADGATGASGALDRTALHKYAGAFTTGVGQTRLYNDTSASWEIRSIRATVETAPSGGSVVVDVHKNGTTVFTTQANRPTITTGNTTSGKVTNMDVTTVAAGDYLTVDVDTTTSPAANLTVELVLR